MKLKIGQQYRIKKPENWTDTPPWTDAMDADGVDGRVITLWTNTRKNIHGTPFITIPRKNEVGFWSIALAWLEPAKMFVEVNGKRTPIALPYDQAQMLAEKTGGTICQ